MSTLVSVRMEPPGPERDAPGSLRNSEVKILKVLSAICKKKDQVFPPYIRVCILPDPSSPSCPPIFVHVNEGSSTPPTEQVRVAASPCGTVWRAGETTTCKKGDVENPNSIT